MAHKTVTNLRTLACQEKPARSRTIWVRGLRFRVSGLGFTFPGTCVHVYTVYTYTCIYIYIICSSGLRDSNPLQYLRINWKWKSTWNEIWIETDMRTGVMWLLKTRIPLYTTQNCWRPYYGFFETPVSSNSSARHRKTLNFTHSVAPEM